MDPGCSSAGLPAEIDGKDANGFPEEVHAFTQDLTKP